MTMSELAQQKIALAKRILETNDAALLRSVHELISGGPFSFSDEEIAGLEEIRRAHLAGEGSSSTWPEARKRIRQAVAAKLGKSRR